MSLLIAGLGVLGARVLSQVDQDLRIMHTEYTLAAVDLAHISADLMRYRATIMRGLEASTKEQFEEITSSLPDQRSRIWQAIERYTGASPRVSHSGSSEPQDLIAVRESLQTYFSTASQTRNLVIQSWAAATPREAAEFRQKAILHFAENGGLKLIQASSALELLLETVAEESKDMRIEASNIIRGLSAVLTVSSFLIALLNLV